MLRLIARIYAKLQLRFKQEVEAATNDLSASLALRNADDHRIKATAFAAEADLLDARIKDVAEMEEKGFWLCEDGHEEPQSTAFAGIELELSRECSTCRKSMKFLRRDLMSGQEEYESDKERKEVQKMADQRREQAKAEEDAACESDRTAKYFHGLAQSNRSVAEKIRAL